MKRAYFKRGEEVITLCYGDVRSVHRVKRVHSDRVVLDDGSEWSPRGKNPFDCPRSERGAYSIERLTPELKEALERKRLIAWLCRLPTWWCRSTETLRTVETLLKTPAEKRP